MSIEGDLDLDDPGLTQHQERSNHVTQMQQVQANLGLREDLSSGSSTPNSNPLLTTTQATNKAIYSGVDVSKIQARKNTKPSIFMAKTKPKLPSKAGQTKIGRKESKEGDKRQVNKKSKDAPGKLTKQLNPKKKTAATKLSYYSMIEIPKTNSPLRSGDKTGVLFRKTGQAILEEKMLKLSMEEVLKEPETADYLKELSAQGTLRSNSSVVLRAKLGKRWHTHPEDRNKITKLVVVGYLKSPAISNPDGSVQSFRIMDLPKEVRAFIWTLAVVRTKSYVVPDSQTGAQQPDLAMANRAVRNEVLPLFYQRNTFAIQSKTIPAGKPDDENESKVKAKALKSEKWAKVMEQAGWLRYIYNWSLNYLSTATRGSAEEPSKDSDFFISIRFTKMEDTECSPVVEVHRSGRCVLSGSGVQGGCRILPAPQWLINDVSEAFMKSGKLNPEASSIFALVEKTTNNKIELQKVSCEDAEVQ